MSRIYGTGRAQHPEPVPTLPVRVRIDTFGLQAPSVGHRGHNLSHTPNTPVGSQKPPPLCAAAPSLRGPFPGAASFNKSGSNRPPARRAPSRPGGPSPAPPPTCCRRGCFHLHLPLTRARPGSDSPQTRPRPAPARPRADSSQQIRPRPPVNTPPFTPPQTVLGSGRGCAGAEGSARKANWGMLPGSTCAPHNIPRKERCGACVGTP